MKTYYELDVGSYPEREYMVHYQESDLNLINRLMEECGIWYFFSEPPLVAAEVPDAATSETMVFTDKPAAFEDLDDEATIRYRSSTATRDSPSNRKGR